MDQANPMDRALLQEIKKIAAHVEAIDLQIENLPKHLIPALSIPLMWHALATAGSDSAVDRSKFAESILHNNMETFKPGWNDDVE